VATKGGKSTGKLPAAPKIAASMPEMMKESKGEADRYQAMEDAHGVIRHQSLRDDKPRFARAMGLLRNAAADYEADEGKTKLSRRPSRKKTRRVGRK
jgi:hypothetical protein